MAINFKLEVHEVKCYSYRDCLSNLQEAERLYLTIKEVDKAITMFKRNRLYKDVIRLVKVHHPDLLEQTYNHLAQELEGEGNFRQAEQYYLEVSARSDQSSCKAECLCSPNLMAFGSSVAYLIFTLLRI